MRKILSIMTVIAISAFIAISCSQNNPIAPSTAPSQGKMMFALDAADNIATGQVTVTKGALTHVLPITIADHSGSVIFEPIQVGHWDILVQLYDVDGVEIYIGTGEAIVTKNNTTTVTIRVEHNTGNLEIIVEVPGLLLWNKLGSDTEVLNSEVGPNGMIVGDLLYLSGQYGNGYEPAERTGDHNIADNYIQYENLQLGPKGCIEFWYQPNWSSSSVGHNVCLLYYTIMNSINDPEQPLGIQIHYNDWQNNLILTVRDDDTNNVFRTMAPGSIPGWSTSTPFHMALTWDGSGATADDKLKLFVNGVAISTTVVTQTGMPTLNWSTDKILYLGTYPKPDDWSRHHWEGNDGIVDNLKIWNYPKTDFSDRFVE
ncbi:LamG domain-containing protein [bacterium]|nr:LamG domain-containing protein [bacterium]